MVIPERPSGASVKAILRFVSVCFCVLLTGIAINGFTARRGTPRDERAASAGWDREGAAKYLDERMELWFTTAKKLRTGQSETACVSCHTTIPYVLARPALRRAMGVSAATPLERRLVEETTRRVESYGDHQPLYDFNESKKTESRGTEAVLNALILASADAAQNRREPSEATQQAFDQMWKTQRPDGAWDWLDFGLEPFESVDGAYYGATLAALAIGIAPGSLNSHTAETRAGIERMRAYLKTKYGAQSNFNRLWLMLAATRLNDLMTKAQRESLIREIQ